MLFNEIILLVHLLNKIFLFIRLVVILTYRLQNIQYPFFIFYFKVRLLNFKMDPA